MESPSPIISQNIFLARHPDIILVSCSFNDLERHFPRFKDSVEDDIIGFAPTYDGKGCLNILALSSKTFVLLITMPRRKSADHSPSSQNLLRDILLGDGQKFAFQGDRLASALFLDHDYLIRNLKDLLSTSKSSRHSLESLLESMGSEKTINKRVLQDIFRKDESYLNNPQTIALQAWAACQAAASPSVRERLTKVCAIDSSDLDKKTLEFVAKITRHSYRLCALKPTSVKHDFGDTKIDNRRLVVNSKRYKTRVRQIGSRQTFQVELVQPNGKSLSRSAQLLDVSGRRASLSIKSRKSEVLKSVSTIGREDPTSVERAKASILMKVLQRDILTSNYPFIQMIWFPLETVSWKKNRASSVGLCIPHQLKLNKSQKRAVTRILSCRDDDRVVLVQGPPGTGKTTVIAASVTSMITPPTKSTMWLVAHSNVAVKNMAEKLVSVNFLKFKIIVSKDFYVDWHEDLYEKIERNLIRSDGFPADPGSAERMLADSRVILCTLSMLSNDRLEAIIPVVPLQTVIFDEASQIEIGDYIPMLVQYRTTLRKLVFIGDDKQLAPYGSNQISDLESIFEKKHLRKRVVFLDTQYRMPIPIGNFISHHIYDKKLKSEHLITNVSCCRFINVSEGVEKREGNSWTVRFSFVSLKISLLQNSHEVSVVIKISRQLVKLKKSFRIITPYDPQRTLLENRLKDAKLPWEDKCFNVDSFQGNEADYIIISLVRSENPGFLTDRRRVNVMLTRCKKAMILCTSRRFIEGPASDLLVGKLIKSLGDGAWIEGCQIVNETFDFSAFIH